MKRIFFSSLLFITQMSMAQMPTPVVHFPFDGNLTDASSSYTFTANTGATTDYVTDRFGNANGAYAIPWGTNQELSATIPNVLPQGAGLRSISVWVKMVNLDANQLHMINLVSYGQNSTQSFGVGTQGEFLKTTGAHTSVSPQSVLKNTIFENMSQWNHIIIVYEGIEAGAGTKIYCNGKLVMNNPSVVWTNTLGDILRLNFQSTPIGQYSRLHYDDLKVYDVALTEAQILQQQLDESPLNQNNLFGYFDFENTLDDYNFANNDLTFGSTANYTTGHTSGSEAVEFDSGSGYFHHTDDLYSTFPDDDFTVSFWRNRTGHGLNNYETDIELFGSFFFRQPYINNYEIGIATGTTSANFTTGFFPALSYNTWDHITLVFKNADGTRRLFVYRDGILLGILTPNNEPMYKINEIVSIGTGTDGSGNNQNNKRANNLIMDNLFLFGRALTEVEIMALRNQVPQVIEPIVYIPDPAFKANLVGNTSININEDNEIQVSEALAFSGTISCTDLGIGDLTGIEAFVNITDLICYGNQLTSLDLSNNTALVQLICDENQLTSLDVSNNSNLTLLWCSDNQLISLNVANGNNENFTGVQAYNNSNLTCIQVDDVVYSNTNWIGGSFGKPIGAVWGTNCSLGIGEEHTNGLTVYPNPASTVLNISFNTGETTAIKIVNVLGATVISTSISNQNNSIDISGLTKGVYFVQSGTSTGSVPVVKFVKE